MAHFCEFFRKKYFSLNIHSSWIKIIMLFCYFVIIRILLKGIIPFFEIFAEKHFFKCNFYRTYLYKVIWNCIVFRMYLEKYKLLLPRKFLEIHILLFTFLHIVQVDYSNHTLRGKFSVFWMIWRWLLLISTSFKQIIIIGKYLSTEHEPNLRLNVMNMIFNAFQRKYEKGHEKTNHKIIKLF